MTASPPRRAPGRLALAAILLLALLGVARAERPGLRVVEVELRSFDGTRIEGTLFLNEAAGEAPLVIAGHGAARSRLQSLDRARTTPDRILVALVEEGLHVLSYDRRGFGGSGGQGQLGHLAIDGADLAAVVDWAAQPGNVPGLARDAAGRPRLGYSGYSMSADNVALMTSSAFQAIFLGIGVVDVQEAYVPGGKPYQGWINALLLMGGRQEFSYHPSLRRLVRQGLRHRRVEGMAGVEEFVRDRTFDCERMPPSPAAVLLMPGLDDTLYPLNHAARLRDCLARDPGREVHLIAQSKGHIIPGDLPRAGRLVNALWPVHNAFSIEDLQPRLAEVVACPRPRDTVDLVAGWMALKLAPERLDPQRRAELQSLPAVCLPLGPEDGVALAELPAPRLRVGFSGVTVKVGNYDAWPDALAVAGGRPGLDAPVWVPLFVAREREVVAGLPRLALRMLDLTPREQRLGKLAVFVGLGRRRPEGEPELLNGQRQPLRLVDAPFDDATLRGVAARLEPGDELGLLVTGHDFFFDAGALITKGGPDRAELRLSGELSIPFAPKVEPLMVEGE